MHQTILAILAILATLTAAALALPVAAQTIDIDDDGKVLIEMTLTSPMCPVADSMPMEVQEKVIAVDGVTDIDLRVVFDPPWDKSKMSEEALLLLDMF